MTLTLEHPKSLPETVLDGSSPTCVEYRGEVLVFLIGKDKSLMVGKKDQSGPFTKLGGCIEAPNTSITVTPGGYIYTYYNAGSEVEQITTDGTRFLEKRHYPKTAGIEKGTTPTAGFYRPPGDIWYIFFVGSNGTIMMSQSVEIQKAWVWGDAVSIPFQGAPPIHPGTGPMCTIFKEKLYLFYNAGNDGLWYNIMDPNNGKWDSPTWFRREVAGEATVFTTNPSLAIVKGGKALMVMWSGIGLDGTWYSLFEDGNWTPQASMSAVVPGGQQLLQGTNACATELNGQLYVFWTGPDCVPRESVGTVH